MKSKRSKRKMIILGSLIGVLCIAFFIAVQVTTIKKVTIEGNEHYTEGQLKKQIFTSKLCNNSLYLYWLYNYGNPPAIPFIDTVEVQLTKANKVVIKVYEKKIVGYVKYLDTCMYFDKDGTVVESSNKAIDKVPLITGLTFNYIVLHEKLTIENESIFHTILNLSQLTSKYQINPDKIYFDKNYNITLYFDKARVYLGKDIKTEDKIVRLQNILPDLNGLSGVLHMEDYSDQDTDITFQKDK